MDKKGAKRSHILYFVVKDIERAFRYMLISNPPADQRDARNASPLHIAARTGNLEMVIFLITIGCPIDLRGENGW
jgi:ankyrin repeat protein